MKYIIGIGIIFGLMGCASTKYKAYTMDQRSWVESQIKGKNPKQTAEALGKPMSAFYVEDRNDRYVLIYPISEEEVSMFQLMGQSDLECMALWYEKDAGYIQDGHVRQFPCSAIKGEKLDTSRID